MRDCLFCKIADGEVDAEIVSESDDVVAFKDIRAAAPTHLLVVPRRHVGSVAELSRSDGELLGEMFEVVNTLARAHNLDGGFRVVTNVGADAGQSVPHVHFHLLGGRHMSWPPG